MALSYGFCLDGQNSTYTSEQFSHPFQAVFGDGVCPFGQQFALTGVENFTVTIGTGFALAGGRWLKNDEALPLALTTADNYADRYDAAAVRVDFAARRVYLEILADVDPAAPPRNGAEHTLYLYLIRVKRGATVLTVEDITDTRGDKSLCGYIRPLSEVSGAVEQVYSFLRSGIDQEVARILALGEGAAERTEAELAELEGRISTSGGAAVGDIALTLSRPAPAAEWLPCDGGAVPSAYPALAAATGGVVPLMAPADPRWGYWIYGGTPG